MSILLLKYEDRGDLYPRLTEINRRVGVDHLFLTETEFKISPYWVKVFLVDKYLSQYDYIIWLDSDAVIFNWSLLPTLEKDFIYTTDPPSFNYVTYGTFNAGIFIVKNSSIGRAIISDWKAGYDPEKWSFTGTWNCPDQWAGPSYEQGYFCEHLLEKYSKHLQKVPQNIMQAYSIHDIVPETFAMHFFVPNKVEYIESFLSKFYSTLVLQYDDRGDIFPELTELNKNSGFNHLFLVKSDFKVAPWWQKIFLIQKYLPLYDTIIWMDSDAGIINPKAIPTSEKTMIYSPDPEGWASPFNAGVFILKNNQIGRELINEWVNGYDPRRWEYTGSNWKHEGDWLGPSLEQGYFNYFLFQKYREHIEILPQKVFQVSDYTNITPETFSLHFPGKYKDNYKQTMQDLLNKRS